MNSSLSKRESVWVSSSKPVEASATSTPYVSKGYAPTFRSIQAICSGVFSSHGSSASRYRVGTTSRRGSPPGPVRRSTVERPMETWASSVAMGCWVRYVQVVLPSARSTPAGRPLATAVVPSGAVTRMVNSALSDGWSLHGNTRWATSAWLAMARPSVVRTQPPLRSFGDTGSLVCRTVIRTQSPSSSASSGVITRSSPAPAKAAGSPSTSTDSTSPCAKSRLIRSRSAVARASMVVTAFSGALLSPE